MRWDKGFSAQYFYTLVDPVTWRDIGTYQLISGSVMKSEDGLMQSGDMEITTLPSDGEVWIRIYLAARQNDTGVRDALMTGLLQTPQRDWTGVKGVYKAEVYSVLKPAEDILLDRGWYAGAGTDAAMVAAELLGVSPAPVSYADNAPLLEEPVVAESHETNLSMAQKLVAAINWRIRIAGDGSISIEPKPTTPSAEFDSLANDIVQLAIADKRDWYSCPNVFRAAIGNVAAVAKDEDDGSPFSIQNRGREIWAEDDSVVLNSGESLEQYATRRLYELQAPSRSISYDRRYTPDVYPGDMVKIYHPAQHINGSFTVTSQKRNLGYGAQVSEECIAYG